MSEPTHIGAQYSSLPCTTEASSYLPCFFAPPMLGSIRPSVIAAFVARYCFEVTSKTKFSAEFLTQVCNVLVRSNYRVIQSKVGFGISSFICSN